MNNTEINILKTLSGLYIISFIFHNIITFQYIRISEYIFIFYILYIIFLIINKKIYINFNKIDFILLLMPILAFILFIISKFDLSFFIGFISLLYFFLIYYTIRNTLKVIKLNFFLKIIILVSIISSILGIIGWILSQLNINNILSINSPYPLSIGKESRASGLFTTPSLLAITNIVSIYIILIFYKKNQNYKYYLILFTLLLGLILTFSKSIVLFLSFFLFFYYNKKNYFVINYIIYISIFILIIFHSIFTSFLIINKNNDNEWLTDNFSPLFLNPIYENNQIKILPTNYTYAKFKSFEIIKKHTFIGVGFNNFKNSLDKKYNFLLNKNPHSSYLGLWTEYGLLMLILYILLFIILLNISFKILKKTNIQIVILIFYFIFEGIHTDVHTIKLLWIIIAITVYLYKNNNDNFI